MSPLRCSQLWAYCFFSSVQAHNYFLYVVVNDMKNKRKWCKMDLKLPNMKQNSSKIFENEYLNWTLKWLINGDRLNWKETEMSWNHLKIALKKGMKENKKWTGNAQFQYQNGSKMNTENKAVKQPCLKALQKSCLVYLLPSSTAKLATSVIILPSPVKPQFV